MMRTVEYIQAMASNRRIIISVLVILILVFVIGKMFIKPNLQNMSPKRMFNLYEKSRNRGDTELLKRIIYFPQGTTEQQKQEKVDSMVAVPDETILLGILGISEKAKYEKLLDENTAEVGTVGVSKFRIGKQSPLQQIIFKKDEGIWKYHYSMWELSKEQLVERLRAHPENTSLYYILGMAIQPDNIAKAHRYLLRYYELEPDGFWADDDFRRRVIEFKKEFEQTEIYEKEILATIHSIHKDDVESKALVYRRLGKLFMELEDYEKANMYFDTSSKLLALSPRRSEVKRLKEARLELQLRIEGNM
ncbi:MAG: hypothetical protein IID32_09410 [Planctomycetes bacterium]|nr:hypothetical protein [Planctomycetota bacterium]